MCSNELMRESARVCRYVFPFQTLNLSVDFYKTLYEHCTIGRHMIFRKFNVPHSVITSRTLTIVGAWGSVVVKALRY